MPLWKILADDTLELGGEIESQCDTYHERIMSVENGCTIWMPDYLCINSRNLAAFQRCHYPVSDVDGKQFGRWNRIKGNLRDLAESGDGASVSEDRPERVECALPCEQDVTRKESGCLDVGG